MEELGVEIDTITKKNQASNGSSPVSDYQVFFIPKQQLASSNFNSRRKRCVPKGLKPEWGLIKDHINWCLAVNFEMANWMETYTIQ